MSWPKTSTRPGVEGQQRADEPDERGLAAAVGAEDAVDLAPLDAQRDVVDGGDGLLLAPPTTNRLVTWSMSRAGTSLRGGAGRRDARSRGGGPVRAHRVLLAHWFQCECHWYRSLSDWCRRTGIGFRFKGAPEGPREDRLAARSAHKESRGAPGPPARSSGALFAPGATYEGHTSPASTAPRGSRVRSTSAAMLVKPRFLLHLASCSFLVMARRVG